MAITRLSRTKIRVTCGAARARARLLVRSRPRGCDFDIDGPASQIAPASASEKLIENDAAIGSSL